MSPTSARNARTESNEFTTAPAHGSISARGAARHQRTARSHAPSSRALGAGVEHQVSTGFGNAVGHPIGSASNAGSLSTSGSMCANPSARAATARSATSPRLAYTTSTTPNGQRITRAGASLGRSLLHRLGHHHADGLEVLAERRVELFGHLRRAPAAVFPHPGDLLGVLEQRVR